MNRDDGIRLFVIAITLAELADSSRKRSAYRQDSKGRSSFVKDLLPNDSCHLNGLGLRDGRPPDVTALGQTNEPTGWRANNRDGGVLIDVASSEIMTRGLSMPHSPRWHDGKLWLLNSGTGGFGTTDPDRGHYEPIAELPGFTRGLSFFGPLAFIGLSQIRESAVFSDIPIAERPQSERNCGVWGREPVLRRDSRLRPI